MNSIGIYCIACMLNGAIVIQLILPGISNPSIVFIFHYDGVNQKCNVQYTSKRNALGISHYTVGLFLVFFIS